MNSSVQILLVDDSNLDVVLFKNALSSWTKPYTLKVLDDGQKALDYLGQVSNGDRPQLIVLDLNLPKVRGVDILKFIREKQALQGASVIIFSGSDRPEEIKKAYELKVTASIKKPMEFEEYRSVVFSMQDLLK